MQFEEMPVYNQDDDNEKKNNEVGGAHDIDTPEDSGILSKNIDLRYIEAGEGGYVLMNLENKKEFHNEFALKFIECGEVRIVAQALEKFEGLSNDVAVKLIEGGFGYEVGTHLGSFKGLKKDIAFKILKDESTFGIKGFGGLIENFDKFAEGDYEDIILEFIEEGWGANIAEHVAGMDAVIASKLIENGQGWVVVKYLENFEDLDGEIVKKVIEDSNNWMERVNEDPSMVKNLEKLKRLA